MTFKVGDKVKILNNDHSPCHFFKIGSVVEVTSIRGEGNLGLKGNPETDGASSQIVSTKCVGIDGIFEDEWHLNNGKVTIPDDAHKLMDNGSVVAFRKRKVKDLEFGDELVGRITGTKYRFIRYTNHLKTHCDALNSSNEIATSQSLTNHLKRV